MIKVFRIVNCLLRCAQSARSGFNSGRLRALTKGTDMIRKLLVGAAMTTAFVGGQAQAVTINLIDVGGVAGSPAARGFAAAAAYWESVFTNDAVLNFEVGFSPLGPNVLGGTRSNLLQDVSISSFYGALAVGQSSALDARAVAGLAPLSPTGSVNVTVPQYLNPTARTGISDTGTRTAPDGRPISQEIAISTANVKALYNDNAAYEADYGAGVVDGNIQFSSTFNFDFDPTDGITAGSYDFIGVAIHEIGHALGFLSGADDFDYSTGYAGQVDNSWWGYAGDLFRYSAPGKLDWTFGTDSYFSIDGGQTVYENGYFSTGENNGDGWQASHWKEPAQACGNFLGIMNPYICGGKEDAVEALDLAFFDAIGWNVNVDVLANPGYTFTTGAAFGLVPEPSTWAMMIGGFGMVGGAMRRRRSMTKVSFA